MREIELTQGKKALVDKEDYPEISKYKWFFLNRGYAARKSGGKLILMHRQLLGAIKGQISDHKNGDKLDNRRKNIRLCTHSQNMANFGPRQGVKYRGVGQFTSSYRSKRKWQARIRIDGKEKVLGYFYSPTAAARAYNRAAKNYYKEFAYQNKI